jgi:hypothetical protein
VVAPQILKQVSLAGVIGIAEATEMVNKHQILGGPLCAAISDSILYWLAPRKFAGKTDITTRNTFLPDG